MVRVLVYFGRSEQNSKHDRDLNELSIRNDYVMFKAIGLAVKKKRNKIKLSKKSSKGTANYSIDWNASSENKDYKEVDLRQKI